MNDGVVRVVVELNEVSPVVIGKVGDFGEMVGVVVEISKDKNKVNLELLKVFDDGVRGIDVFVPFSSNGV